MPASRSAIVTPTDTSRVCEALQIDDFRTVAELAALTGLARCAVARSLWWLQKCRAVECVESSGDIHWFATPEFDARHHVLEERRKEDEPRKVRVKKIKV
jgi:hypothetical protein